LIQQVRVGILGQEYTIYTEADKAYVEEVARYVTMKCEEAKETLRSSSHATILALAALNIASDYLQTKDSYELLLERIERKQKKLSDLLL
jgi:cell division protein ZapA (FtsZ GTPase activity inhibitor)